MLIVAGLESTVFERAARMRLCITTYTNCIAARSTPIRLHPNCISMWLRSAAVQLRKTNFTDFSTSKQVTRRCSFILC
jgi:hypothetical protein